MNNYVHLIKHCNKEASLKVKKSTFKLIDKIYSLRQKASMLELEFIERVAQENNLSIRQLDDLLTIINKE